MTTRIGKKEEISFEEIKELLPKSTSLIYVDRNDDLDNCMDAVQKCIIDGNFDALNELLNDAYSEHEYDHKKEYRKQLRKDIQQKFDLSKRHAKDIMECYSDQIDDVIYERNDVDIIKDLSRNTSNPVMFYSTGLEIDEGSWQWKSPELTKWRRKVKRQLGINGTFMYDSAIDMMLLQASYGGELVIYFRQDVNDLLEAISTGDKKTIRFSNAMIAISKTSNGSGDHCHIPKHTFELEFNKENLFVDKLIKYNYTYQVCGMSSDWCDSTDMTLLANETGKKVEISGESARMEQEAKYNETYKNGGCTFGDMDINRHRNTPYRNDFPCGNTCTQCGTFWID